MIIHYRRDPHVKKVVRMLIALALLPVHKVEEGVQVFIFNPLFFIHLLILLINVFEFSLQYIVDYESMNLHGQHPEMVPLFAYHEKNWINIMTPRLFSVYGDSRRTNND